MSIPSKVHDLPRINLHIHSDYSDGKNSIKQIIEYSIKSKFNYVAITDHLSNTWKSKVIPTLDTNIKIENYLNEISSLNDTLTNDNRPLRVLKGVEIDLGSEFDYIIDLINPDTFDIVLFEYLETPESLIFIEEIIKYWKSVIPRSVRFPLLGLAHFDPSTFLHYGYDSLLQFIQANNIYYELNSRYSEFYSNRYKESLFNKIEELNILVGIGTDSHNLNTLNNIAEIIEVVSNYNLRQNLYDLTRKIATAFEK